MPIEEILDRDGKIHFMKLNECQDYEQTDSSEILSYQIVYPLDMPRFGLDNNVEMIQICYDKCKRDWSL